MCVWSAAVLRTKGCIPKDSAHRFRDAGARGVVKGAVLGGSTSCASKGTQPRQPGTSQRQIACAECASLRPLLGT